MYLILLIKFSQLFNVLDLILDDIFNFIDRLVSNGKIIGVYCKGKVL